MKGNVSMPVGSIIQSLFCTALGRAVPIIYQKIVRRSKVDAAMRGEPSQNSAIKQAIADYEIIVGSTYGQLTESLDRFLRQLESSGIVVTMAEEAIVRKRTELTRRTFCSLHMEILGPSAGDAERLYDQIATSFEASLELLVTDPAIALLIAQWLMTLPRGWNGLSNARLQWHKNDHALTISKKYLRHF
jgi:hypothetical protein